MRRLRFLSVICGVAGMIFVLLEVARAFQPLANVLSYVLGSSQIQEQAASVRTLVLGISMIVIAIVVEFYSRARLR